MIRTAYIMGAGASVYKRNVGALWNLYNARTGWLIREGRVVFAEGIETTTADTPTIDYNTDSDDTTGIDYDSDAPYAEAYDGPLADDHPMVVELRDRVFGPIPPPAADAEAEPPDEVMSASSESWEWFTNTRGGGNGNYDFDWIPDLETMSDSE